jgi:hypothetical protein
MNRVYLPLFPLPVLALIVAFSACSKARTEETTHVIPPAVAAAPPEEAKVPAPPVAIAARGADDKPTAEDVKEFERKVSK